MKTTTRRCADCKTRRKCEAAAVQGGFAVVSRCFCGELERVESQVFPTLDSAVEFLPLVDSILAMGGWVYD